MNGQQYVDAGTFGFYEEPFILNLQTHKLCREPRDVRLERNCLGTLQRLVAHAKAPRLRSRAGVCKTR